MTHDELDAILLAAEEENKRGSDFAKAEKLAREAMQQLTENKTSASEALHIRALLVISESFWRRGLAKDALPIAEQALAEATNAPSSGIRELEAKALSNIGSVYDDLSQYAKALEYYEKAFALHEVLANKAGVAADTGNIGNVYTHLSQYPKAIEQYEKALAISYELNNKPGVAIYTGNLGNVFAYLSEYATALEYYEKSVALDEELGNIAGVARVTGSIGLVCKNLGEYSKAIENLEKALALDEELGNLAGVARHTGCIGILYLSLSEYSKALEYLQKALALDEELGNTVGVASQTSCIGCVYHELSEFAKALEYFERALKLSEDIGDRRGVGLQLSNIGSTLNKIGKNKQAMDYYQGALHLLRAEIESNEGITETLINIGILLSEENRMGEAIKYLDEGLALAERLGQKRNASDAFKELAAIYKKLGDTAKTLEHTEKYYALKEEIFSDDTRKRVEAFNFRVATANKERDLKLAWQEKELAVKDLAISQQILRLKERDLANTASSLAAQTELLSDFRADLRKIVLRPDRYEPEDIIKQVRAKLKELPCEMIDFGKFEAQFATVHPEFRAKLETTYPELTPQEIKICMLMHVNLKSAAIARLTCLSERTVEDHRANIRKKMKLTRSEDLIAYLAKL